MPRTTFAPDWTPRQGYDVVVAGGGITGAATFRELRARGYSALLVDKADFASGTSQASGMLAWGGLLYLKNLELGTVRKLSRDRDDWIREAPEEVRPAGFRYFPTKGGDRSAAFVRAALELYWWLGGRRPERPSRGHSAPPFVAAERFGSGIDYGEAAMVDSDARVVLSWILGSIDAHRHARNLCAFEGAHFDGASGSPWTVGLRDGRSGQAWNVSARALVCAGGHWTNRMADAAGLRTSMTHVGSKGVYLVIERPAGLDRFLVFEEGARGDVLTLTPWHGAALFGPTETFHDGPLEEGFRATAEDVRFLVRHLDRCLGRPVRRDEVLGLRAGLRPLVTRAGARIPSNPLSLSRKHCVEVHGDRKALLMFGGKFTSARRMAREACDALGAFASPDGAADGALAPPGRQVTAEVWPDGGRRVLPDPAYARDVEGCPDLTSYLRRRTNLSQTVRRLGLGLDDGNLEQVERIASAFPDPVQAVIDLRSRADAQDRLLDSVLAPDRVPGAAMTP